MSSILKALKKLEQEKARRQEGSMDLARDILRGDVRRLGLPLWLLPLGVALLVTLVAVGGYLLLSGEPTVSPAPPLAVSTAAPAAVEASPQSVAPPVRLSYQDAAIIEEVVDSRRPPAPAPPLHPPRPRVSPIRTQHPVAAAPRATPAPESPRPAPLLPAPSSPVVVPPIATASVAHASLEVSAIAFQQDREARLAVVNDLPVMEGTFIGKAMVEEILADRVIFSQDGTRFAAILNLSPP